MELTLQEIAARTEDGFTRHYPNFKPFRQDARYHAYWALCMEAVSDRDLLVSIQFANDYFWIPPVKSFLTRYREEICALLEADGETLLSPFLKRSIGAFWGTVFKYVLGYESGGPAAIAKKKAAVNFGLRSASFFCRGAEPISIIVGGTT